MRTYRRDTLRLAAGYIVVMLCSAQLVRHGHIHGWKLYFWSVLPAIPIIGMILRMARYLQDESDEFQRLLMMRAILVGTAALLAAVVVNDFVRAFAGGESLPPFVLFLIFCCGMGMMQMVQRLKNRVKDDE